MKADDFVYEFLKPGISSEDVQAIGVLLGEFKSGANALRLERIVADDHLAIARNEGGVIVGMAALIIYAKPTTGMTALVEDVVVLDECRNQGIARQLMDMLIRKACSHDCAYMFLTSSEPRVAARHLYEQVLMFFKWPTTPFRLNLEKFKI